MDNPDTHIDPSFAAAEEFDFKQIGKIVEAMDRLRLKAKRTGNDEMRILINSAFNICFSSYYLSLRMDQLPRDIPQKTGVLHLPIEQ